MSAIKYDQLSRTIFESYPNAITGTTFSYDGLDRVTLKKHADGSSVRYVYDGFVTQEINELNQSTTYRYVQHGADCTNRMMELMIQPENIYTIIERNRLNQVTRFFQGEKVGTGIQGYSRLYNYDSKYLLASEQHVELGQLNVTNKLINY